MAVRTASGPTGYQPIERPSVSVANDGTLAAIIEPRSIAVVEIPGGAAFAEVGIDPEATSSDVMWVGAPPRLLVLSRYAAHSTVHLIDPYGPRTVAEIRLETPMKLYATVGSHALAIGTNGTAILATSDSHITPYQFPARSVPVVAGAASTVFVVALAGSIEEWDPQSRMPKRRLRLPKPAAITAVGGSDRVVWMTTQNEPARIDVIPHVNRGQPKFHELPEPIARVSSHPRSDLVVCLGADTGRLYVVDLDGRAPLRVIGPEGIDRTDAAALVMGRLVGVLAAQAGRPVAIVTLERERDELEPHPAPLQRPPLPPPTRPLPSLDPTKRSTLYGDESPNGPRASGEPPTVVTPDATVDASPPRSQTRPLPSTRPPAPPPDRTPRDSRGDPSPREPVVGLRDGRPGAASHPDDRSSSSASLVERLSASRVRSPRPSEVKTTWRDEVVSWARGVVASAVERAAPPAPPIDAIVQRLEIAHLHTAVVFLYGAHLAGFTGVAPYDLSRVLGHRWDEALGRGDLAASGVAVYADSRVRLTSRVQRQLDELPPETGVLVGEPGAVALLGPCVVVAPEGPIEPIARACLGPVGGAILAAHSDTNILALFDEAQVYGAVPMVRTVHDLPGEPSIRIVADAEFAAELGLPRLDYAAPTTSSRK